MKERDLATVDLNLLKVFVAVYRERSLEKAGGRLFVSPSAVSHSLSRLRLLFSDHLFLRTSHGLNPTALAERLIDPIGRALQSAQDALNLKYRFDPAEAVVEFSVGVATPQPSHLLQILYATLERTAPKANLFLRSLAPVGLEASRALECGDVDLVLMVGGTTMNEFDTNKFCLEELCPDPLVCVVSKSNRDVGASMTIEAYARLPHLIVSTERVRSTTIDTALAARGLRRRIAAVAPHPHAFPLLMGGSRLVATLTRSQAEAAAERGDVRILAAPINEFRATLAMIWHTRTSDDPALRWFRELLRGVSGPEPIPPRKSVGGHRGGGSSRVRATKRERQV